MAEDIEREAAREILCGWCHERELCDGSCLAEKELDAIPAADVVARDCFDKILAENDDMRAIIDTYGGLENIQSAFVKLHEIETADVVPVVRGKWVLDGVQMIINLENAREQYKELGYPHRNVLRMRCSNCKKITMVDASIRYEYCPHCGADMREVEHENG